MLYESKKHPLISRRRFLRRMVRHTLFAFALIVISLAIGVAGYMYYEHLAALEALLNAAMLLGGMGPVDMPQTDHGKLFASFYALYAGFVLLATVGFVMAPVAHRLLHRFHLAEEEEGKNSD